MKYLLMLLFLVGCGMEVDVEDSDHTISVVNPIIEFCERLHPPILYPDEIERQEGIVSCMKICSTSSDCAITVPVEALEDIL